MVKAMEEMVKQLNQPETVAECDFLIRYGDMLHKAVELGKRCIASGSDRDLHLCWKAWHHLHTTCGAAIKEDPLSIDLNYVAPTLAQAKNLVYSVPGKYVVIKG